MKTCPNCAHLNEEAFPTCVWCNADISAAPSGPQTAPNHPEFEQQAIFKERFEALHRRLRFAGATYTAAVTAIVAVLSVTDDSPIHPLILACFCATAALVAYAVIRGVAGQLLAPLSQGILSAILFLIFQYLHPMVFLFIAAHILFAVLLWHWVDAIYDMNR